MKYILMIAIAILFIGCSAEEKRDLTTYDFWEYRVSDTNITKVYDLKVFENDFLISTTYTNKIVNEEYQNEDTVSINGDYNITKYESYIENNTTIEQRLININDSVSDNCKLHKHYNIYNPIIDVDFEDVIQLRCDSNSMTVYVNYSKEYGNIGYVYQDGNYTILEYYTKISNYKIDEAF